MKRTMTFYNVQQFKYKEKEGLPDASKGFEFVIESINGGYSYYLCDLITEAAQECIDIYTDDLYKNALTQPFIYYINSSISEFGHSERFEEQLKQAEYCYFYEMLILNLDELVKNSIIEYLKKKSITIEGNPLNIELVIANINNYITAYLKGIFYKEEEQSSNILTFFDGKTKVLLENLSVEHNVKITYSDIDSENKTLQALLIQPDKAPELIEIPESNTLETLQQYVEGNIEIISLYTDSEIYNIDLICNEEGKLFCLTHNRTIFEDDIIGNNGDSTFAVDTIMGTCIILASNCDGDFISLPKDEVKRWSARFKETEKYLFGSKYLDNEFMDIPNFSDYNKKEIKEYNNYISADELNKDEL